jgi:iron complex outermembrane receptor protein
MKLATESRLRSAGAGLLVLVSILALGPGAAAQQGVIVQGRLFNALSQEPIAGARVTVEELRRDTMSGADGTYRFENVPPGTYHVLVRVQGYNTQRTEVAVGSSAVSLDIEVGPELHFTEVVSVSPQARNQFESYQPTTVLGGQDLAIQLQGSLGAALEAQPGIAERSFGPAPSRPVIRGLDGDRVLILEDGQRTGDLSSQSGDHGVNINPAAASRIEVVRGPASLLYGSNAIGGLVNVITETIPIRRLSGVTGSFTFDGGTAASEAGGAGSVDWGNGRVALHADLSGRRSGDVATPEGDIENTQSRGGFGNLGVSWTGDRSYAGGSYGYDDVRYGIPFIEGGEIQLTPRRHTFSLRAGGNGLDGAIESYRVTLGHRRYRHEELEGDEVGTRFSNDTTELEALVSHRQMGRLKGTVGGWVMNRAFAAVGEEALSPPVDHRGVAGFIYEEVTWPHLTLQFGGRVEHARYEPEIDLPARNFTNFSGSLGLLVQPAVTRDNVTIALSLARAARHPALEELYFEGEHPGNFAFEIGNPELESERAIGFDLSLRWKHPRASGEVTYFINNINDYIFRNPVEDDDDHDLGHDHDDEFPIIEFLAADSRLQGIEMHGDLALAQRLFAELGLDYVRGTVSAAGGR